MASRLAGVRYGSCSSLSRHLVGVGVPAFVGLLGLVLVVTAPSCPGAAVGLVAAGLGDDGAAELSQQLRNGDGDQPGEAGAGVEGALAGGGHREEGVGEQADRGPAVPGGPGGDLAAVQTADLLRQLVVLLDSPAGDGDGDQLRQRDRAEAPAQEIAGGAGVAVPSEQEEPTPFRPIITWIFVSG